MKKILALLLLLLPLAFSSCDFSDDEPQGTRRSYYLTPGSHIEYHLCLIGLNKDGYLNDNGYDGLTNPATASRYYTVGPVKNVGKIHYSQVKKLTSSSKVIPQVGYGYIVACNGTYYVGLYVDDIKYSATGEVQGCNINLKILK